MTTTEYFEALGSQIAARWLGCHFDNAALPDIACDVLSTFTPTEHLDMFEMIKWVLKAQDLPHQVNLDSPFGDVPLTMFSHSHFYIEALYWTTGTTTIHQHGFSGAFAVLAGSRIQSKYEFVVRRRVNAHFLLGYLVVREVRLLRSGDVQPIVSGGALIHSVFHLDSPSVTIVVRTLGDIEHQPQYAYRRPFLALNPKYNDPIGTRRLQMLTLLSTVRPAYYDEAALLGVRQADLPSTYQILRQAHAVLRGGVRFDAVRQAARTRHGEDVAALEVVIEEEERQTALIRRRAMVTHPDLRFFLALLLNVHSRASLFSLVAERCPGEQPSAKVAQWVFDLWPYLVDMKLTSLNREMFVALIEGLLPSELVSRLATRYSQMESPTLDLATECERMRTLPVFRPLFETAL